MSPSLKKFLYSWLINTFAVLVTAQLVHGIRYDSITALLVATLVLGVLNAFLRPALMLLSLPFLIVTLGLFTMVINALLLYWVGNLVWGFHVDSFWAAFWGALLIGIISLFLHALTNRHQFQVVVRRGQPLKRRDDDDGPVMNV